MSRSILRAPALKPVVLMWTAAVFLCVCYVSVVLAGFKAPLGYDESYNAQVALHLARDGRYATDGALYGGGSRLFDAYISTGPTVLVPAGLLVWAFGGSVWALRLAPTLGFLFLAAMSAAWGRRIGGSWGAAAGLAALLTIRTSALWPHFASYGPGDLMGEMTCAAFLMAAAWRLPKVRLAGVLMGFAVLTKVLALTFVPAFAASLLLIRTQDIRQSAARSALLFLGWVLAPLLAWQLVRLLTLGSRAYTDRTVGFLQLFVGAGSGIQAVDPPPLGLRLLRLMGMQEQPWLLLLLAVVTIGLLVARLSRLRTRSPMTGTDDLPGQVTALAVGASTLLVWWLFVSSLAIERHALIGVIVLVVLGVAATVRLVVQRPGPSALPVLAGGVLGAFLVVSVATRAYEGWHLLGVTRVEQQQAAAVLTSTHVRRIGFQGWWQNPELRVLTGIPAQALDDHGGLLVLDPLARALDPVGWSKSASLCDRTVYRRDGYLFCEVDPS